MKKKLVYFTLLACLFLSTDLLLAQDILHFKKKKESIQVKVLEIGTGEIKYKLWEEREDGLIYVEEKRNISHIEFANGRTEYFGEDLIDAEEYFEGQDKRALKISFLGPLTGWTTFAYEQNVKPGRSWEARATIVGLGFNNEDRDAEGFIGAFGYKFYKKPTFITSDTRRRHILQGFYFKPEIFVARTTFDDYDFFSPNDQRRSDTAVGLLLNLGMQWVFGDNFVVNLVGGIGYGGGDSVKAYWVNDDATVSGMVSLDIGFTF